MQPSDNISDRQKIFFGNTENGRLWRFQSTDNQYRYSRKITPNSTGKELDAETGYSYFGARYLNHTLTTAWLSIDPMSDKYPSISPYAYCAWNPVKLVDPLGMDTIFPMPCHTSNKILNESNRSILRWLRGIGDMKEIVSVGVHGNDQYVEVSSSGNDNGTSSIKKYAKDFADVIETYRFHGQLPTYERNKQLKKATIFLLYSCHTGAGENSFARQLSTYLENDIIIAPAGYVAVSMNDNHFKIDSRTFRWFSFMNEDWRVFVNGEMVSSFSGKINPRRWISIHGGVDNFVRIIKHLYNEKTKR